MKKTWAEELVALADRIKVLNDDDALELLKKTMLSSTASFMEIKVTRASMVKRALSAQFFNICHCAVEENMCNLMYWSTLARSL